MGDANAASAVIGGAGAQGGGGGGGGGGNGGAVGKDDDATVTMPWWGLFDARDEEVELVCSELLTLYRAHDDTGGDSNNNCNGGNEGISNRDGDPIGGTAGVGSAGGEAGPVDEGGGGETRGVAASLLSSFADDSSKRRNSFHGS